MKTKLFIASILVAASLAAVLTLTAKPKTAYCAGCLATQCSNSVQCGTYCHCEPFGATGFCTGNGY